jgi:hypothetical protein
MILNAYFLLGLLCGIGIPTSLFLIWLITPLTTRAKKNGLILKPTHVLKMFLRRTPRKLLVDTWIELKKSGYYISLWDIEYEFLKNPHSIKNKGDLEKLMLNRSDLKSNRPKTK